MGNLWLLAEVAAKVPKAEIAIGRQTELNSTNQEESIEQKDVGKREKSQCNVCQKKVTNMAEHMRTHTGEKPYSCSKCGKSFARSYHVKTHMMTHTGEKPYSCPKCGKSFSQSCNMKRHMKTHTGEKSYSCPTCGKNFFQSDNMKKHMRIHTDKTKIIFEKPHENSQQK
uniref:Zinc finger protein n=1 Tax=Loa loa TaxID=7209 RepID=A0A1I7VFC2_LOALO